MTPPDLPDPETFPCATCGHPVSGDDYAPGNVGPCCRRVAELPKVPTLFGTEDRAPGSRRETRTSERERQPTLFIGLDDTPGQRLMPGLD